MVVNVLFNEFGVTQIYTITHKQNTTVSGGLRWSDQLYISILKISVFPWELKPPQSKHTLYTALCIQHVYPNDPSLSVHVIICLHLFVQTCFLKPLTILITQ